jgi:hypothetical protein
MEEEKFGIRRRDILGGKGEEIKEHLKEWLLVFREKLSCLEVIDLGCFLFILEVNAL